MQYTIHQQLELEGIMSSRGRDKFLCNTKKAEEAGRACDTTYGRRLIPEYVEPVVDALDLYIADTSTGGGAKYKALLAMADPYQAAYFALRTIFNNIILKKPIHTICASIGQLIEDEIKFTRFHDEHKEYFNTLIDSFDNRNITNYQHKHRVLTHRMNFKGVAWNSWTPIERFHVGSHMVRLVHENTDLIEIFVRKTQGKHETVVRPTEQCMEWIQKNIEHASMLNPELMPCIIKPNDWTTFDDGGYYSPELRKICKLVTIRNGNGAHRDVMRRSDLSSITGAVNLIQAVPWEINKEVHECIKDVWTKNLRIGLPPSQPLKIPACPLPKELKKEQMDEEQEKQFTSWKMEAAKVYTDEKTRVSKCFQAVRVLKLANAYSQFDQFYFPYITDFRARFYTTSSGFSPQGPNFGKGIIRFKNGKRVGERGAQWFMIHGANKFGYDKDTYKDRILKIKEHHDEIMNTCDDPLSTRDFWGNADKPWQFLAWCYEYKGMCKDGHDFVSHLPVALDGSCNGLQHYSAALLDIVGGGATNLLPSTAPADIYQDVADVVLTKLKSRLHEPMAELWLSYGVNRKLTKKPVMTLPYGSTRQTCTSSIFDNIIENKPKHFGKEAFQAALYLTPLVWDAIGEVVVAARRGMGWLQKVASIMAKKNVPILWHSPAGFPCYQANPKIKTRRIKTKIAGGLRLRFGEFTDKLSIPKQKSGIAPNFVHSLDASHMMFTLQAAHAEGITDFACIHDDYGVHAADTDRFAKIIREQFIRLYTEFDPLVDFKREQEEAHGIELPPLPGKGALDITAVARSPYFFG